MARTVSDAAILLSVLVGADKTDSITSQATTKGEKDYTKFLQKDGLKGARIGVARQYFRTQCENRRVIEPNLKVLKDDGATLIDVNFPTFGKFGDAEFEVLLYEFKADLNKYLGETRRKI